MKKIKTTDIAAGVAYPPSKKGLDFLQQSYQEVLSQLAQSMIGDTPSTTIGYVLYGCRQIRISGSDFQFTAGAIYFNEEVYALDAISTITIASNAILTITTINDPVADPTEFTDHILRNVHNIRKLVISDGALGSGTINFKDLIYLQTTTVPFNPTLTGYNSSNVLVASGVTSITGLDCYYSYDFRRKTIFIHFECTSLNTAATVNYINIPLPISIPSPLKAYGMTIAKFFKSGTVLPSLAEIKLNYTGAGSDLNVKKQDLTDYGALTGMAVEFNIEISMI